MWGECDHSATPHSEGAERALEWRAREGCVRAVAPAIALITAWAHSVPVVWDSAR